MSDFQSKIIEVKHLVTEVTDLFIKQKSVLDSMSETISKFGKGAKLPSEFSNAQKEVNKNLEKQSDLQKLIEENAKKQTSAIQRLTKEELSYTQAVEKGVKAKEKEFLANEKLNRAYVQLTASREKAKNKLQDLIASESASNREIRQAQKEFDILNRKVAQADKAIGKFSQANSGIKALTGSVGSLMGAFGIGTGIYLATDIAKSIYENTKQLQSLDLALKMVSGSQEEFVSNQVFLKSLAEQYGIEIKGLTKNFTEFWVASKGKLEAEQIKAIFTSISKSVAVMGLSVEQQDSAFLALQQMMSKGTVQAEELKKQLGNALPGAVKAATMAYQALHPEMKVTEKFFMEQMKAGKVLSSELLPELAKAYEKLYGIENVKRAETLQAVQERLANSWTDLIRAMNESNNAGLAKFLKSTMEMLGNFVNFTKLLFKDEKQLQEYFKNLGAAKGFQEYDSIMKNIAGTSKEQQEITKKALIERERQTIKTNLAIIASEKKKRESILGGDRALFHLQTKLEEDALVQVGKSAAILKRISESKNTVKVGSTTVSSSETSEQKKKRLEKENRDSEKLEKERLDFIEKNAKTEYNLKMSNLEKEKQLAQDKIDLASTLKQNEDIKYQDTIDATIAYNKILLEIERAKYEEDVRLAKGNISEKEIAYNKWFVTVLKLSKDNADSLNRITKEYAKKESQVAKEMLVTFEDNAKAFEEIDKTRKKNQEQSDEDSYRARIKIFNDYVGDFANKSGFGESFDLMTKINPKTNKSLFESLLGDSDDGLGEWEDYFTAISTIAQDAFNLINQASEQRFEKEYQRLEKDKENALRFAGDSESQRLRIEEEYEKRRKEIARKQWQAKKRQAISNILIDTAQAVVSTLAQQPGGAISKSIAAAVIGGLGLVQVGIVASQKAPEFYVGTQNAPEGLAWTNERGAELHTDKKGNIKDFGDNKGARLTMLEAGDKIYTAEQTKRILFNDELNNILTSNNIMPSSINIESNGVSATQMDAIIGKHFSNIQTNNTMIDRNGFTSWTEKNGNKTISDNNRVQRKGLIIKG